MQSWGAYGNRAGYSLMSAGVETIASHFTVKAGQKLELPRLSPLDRSIPRCRHNRLLVMCD